MINVLETFSDEEVKTIMKYNNYDRIIGDHNKSPDDRYYKLVRNSDELKVRPTSEERARKLALSIADIGWDSQSAKCFAKQNQLFPLMERSMEPFNYETVEEGNHRCKAVEILKFKMKKDISLLRCEEIPFLIFNLKCSMKEVRDYCTCKFSIFRFYNLLTLFL